MICDIHFFQSMEGGASGGNGKIVPSLVEMEREDGGDRVITLGHLAMDLLARALRQDMRIVTRNVVQVGLGNIFGS